MNEQEFWSSTPNKIYAIAKIHLRVNGKENKEETPKKNITWYKVLD